jgi:hypothetical protein
MFAWAYGSPDYTQEWAVLGLAAVGIVWGVWMFRRRISLTEMLCYMAYWTIPAAIFGHELWEAMNSGSVGL